MSIIDSVSGRAIPLRGDDIDTDRIIPARFLRAVSFEGLEGHLSEDDRRTRPDHSFSAERYRGATVALVNANFGCGSSREHAPQALYRWGIRAMVGESFSEIFFGNSVAIGLPCVTATREAVGRMQEIVEADAGVAVVVDLRERTVRIGAETFAVALPGPAREAFLSGAWDATGLLLERYHEVDGVAGKLPYLGSFTSSRNAPAAFDSSPDLR
jgi:3-isopropylmalate/(R)-2-methylmalate dehydratase small subunit